MAVAITRPPTVKPTNISIKMEGTTFTATWKNPSALTDSNRNDRAERLWLWWHVTGTVDGIKYNITVKSRIVATDTTSNILYLHYFTDRNDKSYTRNSWHPYTTRTVDSVYLEIIPENSAGWSAVGKGTRNVYAPLPPELSDVSVSDLGVFSAEIEPFESTDGRERNQTEWQADFADTESGYAYQKSDWGTSTTNDEFTRTKSVPGWQALGYRSSYRIRARSRGIGGDSAWVGYKMHVTGVPKPATIKGNKPGGTSADSRGALSISTNAESWYPVDGVTLQMLVNTTASTAEEAIASDDWEDTDFKDDGSCTALAYSVGDATPDPGKRTWVRVKSWRDIEAVFFTFSAPLELSFLYRQTGGATDVSLSVSQGQDGQSLVALAEWEPSGTASPDEGTMFAWSTDPQAWDSTAQPETFQLPDVGVGVERDGSALLVIRGLEEGIPVYVRAIRYQESDAGTVYGDWTDAETGIPSIAPSEVVLSAPSGVTHDGSFRLSWAFSVGGTQSSWQVVGSYEGTIIASGDGPVQSCTIEVRDAAYEISENVLGLMVGVSTGGDWEWSAPVEILVADPPTLETAPLYTVYSTPVSIAFDCDSDSCDVSAVVRSLGVSGDPAVLMGDQLEGDVVWSGTYPVSWAWSETRGEYIGVLPIGTPDIRDGGLYELVAIAVDRETGLASEPVSGMLSVSWIKQAIVPGTPGIEPYVRETDGFVERGVEISLVAPEYFDNDDVYDVFRVAGGIPVPVIQGVPLDAVVVDPYAPFGPNTSYRVRTRTQDGDSAWADFEYSLPGNCLRLDWDGKSVELPWDVEISDSWEKSFDKTKMLDGGVTGSWGPGSMMTGSYSSVMIRLEEEEQIALVRELARWAGPVFVRTVLGTAFPANVEVDTMDITALGGRGMAVSLSIDAIEPSGEFMARLEES